MKKKLFTLLLALVAIATTARAQNTINGHEYVDLGLPSGTLWATCNVGATKPEDYGLYFAWGETVGYMGDTSDGRLFDWANYKFGESAALTKYTGSDKTVLDSEDDAATANWGGNWRMPTFVEINELLDNTTNEWTELNGVKGRKFTAKNGSGNFIFLPASGYRDGGSLNNVGSHGLYWSSSLYESNPAGAYDLNFHSARAEWVYGIRYYGLCVRPVAVKTAELLLNAANFPDANFRAALASILGISEGDEITAEKIASTTYLNVGSKSIADLTGIEHFTALTVLDCYENQLTSLDVSKNTALTELRCYSNQIKGKEMDALVASLPMVESGDFFVINTKDENEGNVCTKSQVSVAKEKGWTIYDYNGGSRQEYEGSEDAAAGLLLNAANFPDANFRAALASKLGISEGDEITEAMISATTWLNVSYKSIADLTGIEHFTALIKLYCQSNQLTSLDVSKNTALKELRCDENQLTSLVVSKNTALTELDCDGNQLTSLDVSKNTALKYLHCSYNQLTSLDVSKNTALTRLWCYNNQLTSLDVSGCTALENLFCHHNQLNSLDVSQNIALESLACYYNQLTSLDVSKNTALKYLYCYKNQLNSLDVSKNTSLKHLYCYSNQIQDEAMDALIASLPTVENGEFYVINTKDTNEGNVCTKSQVAVAKRKGWTVYDFNGSSSNKREYEGSEDPEQEIDPVDEDDNIDYGSDMDENDDLNGNVIGDIFYNIGNGNGEYNAEEGCIVLKKTTDDETVDGLSGKDIFGEDFKGQFTGIVFKVPSGKGTVKVTAETTGNMLLKVKIGDGDPVEMELNGKLKISFPYNVSETTFVAIYAGTNNEAKGFGKASSTDAALKIYGIEFLRDDVTGIDAPLNDNGEMINDNWYSVDGVKLSGEPTKKGIYIHNGKKVVK